MDASQNPKRSHLWQKGQPSANPGGRPKGLARAVKEVVGEDGRDLINTFAQLWRGESPEGWGRIGAKERMEAGKWLADRGFGKALDVSTALAPEQAGALLDLDDQTLAAVIGALKTQLAQVQTLRKSEQAADRLQDTPTAKVA